MFESRVAPPRKEPLPEVVHEPVPLPPVIVPLTAALALEEHIEGVEATVMVGCRTTCTCVVPLTGGQGALLVDVSVNVTVPPRISALVREYPVTALFEGKYEPAPDEVHVPVLGVL
jgi:hypothetical protein